MLNLYEILKEVLNESVSSDSVNDAINNKYRILINYDDEDNHATGTRLVEPYVLGYTRAGNLAFRGYQYEGDTVRGVPKWKLFRLDRVINWQPTKQKFNVEPRDNGWSAESYNSNGDGSLTSILNQVSFDKKEELFSPNDRLNTLRKKTDRLKNSTPINISQMQNQPKPNNSGPITNNVTNSVSNQNTPDFQKMLDRNLELTRKEKAKRNSGWLKNNRYNEQLCDLNERIAIHRRNFGIYASSFKTSDKGIRLSEIKKEENILLFAMEAAKLIKGLFRFNITKDWCIITTPRRRHKSWHFATMVCKKVSEIVGVPFYEDVLYAPNRDRLNPKFELLKDIKEKNIIIYDDIITTGKTIESTVKPFKDRNVLIIVGK